MKRGNFFKFIRNFLAIWAGGLVLVFIVAESVEIAETIVASAKSSFAIVTDWRVVVFAMGIAIILSIIFFLIEIFSKKKKE